ncbi:MAG: hypothetical protein ABI596_07635 [Pyrinomonadaceae bacterium]
MGTESDRARLVAERIARRVAGGSSTPPAPSPRSTPASSELAEIRSVLTDLQRKLDRFEARIEAEPDELPQQTRGARFHNFVGTSSPAGAATPSKLSSQPSPQAKEKDSSDRFSEFAPPTHSPWLSGVYVPATHSSQEKFGVEEATVSELVEFFENEKKCAMEPGDKPCDHCAMCNTRGF